MDVQHQWTAIRRACNELCRQQQQLCTLWGAWGCCVRRGVQQVLGCPPVALLHAGSQLQRSQTTFATA